MADEMINVYYDKRTMYVPMPEMHDEMIPVTQGCSYNKCLYCDLNQRKFSVYDIEEIKKFIRERADFYKDKKFVPKKFNLLEGNPLSLKTNFLIEVMQEINKNFDSVKFISMFARSDDVLRKSDEELLRLKANGMDRLCIGVESGCDEVLKFHQKGVTSEDQLRALKKLERLGINYSCYIMLGLGGVKYSEKHIDDTIEFLNKTKPFEIAVVNMVVFRKARLVEKIRNGEFERISIRRQIEEEIKLIDGLTIDTIYTGTHKTKSLSITSKLPEGKELLIEKLEEHLKLDDRTLTDMERFKWTHKG